MSSGNRIISKKERWLHWIVAVGMIALIGVGLYMSENEVYSLYMPHKSIGIILFLFIMWRVVQRARLGWPENISMGPSYERVLARIIHWILIIGTVLMPISGMLYSWGNGHGLEIFSWIIVPENTDYAGKTIPINATLGELGNKLHKVVGKVLIGVIILHVIGALKHHFIDRDRTLTRMIFGTKKQ